MTDPPTIPGTAPSAGLLSAILRCLETAHAPLVNRAEPPCWTLPQHGMGGAGYAATRCHLRYDIDEHMANAAATRRNKKIAAGQVEIEV